MMIMLLNVTITFAQTAGDYFNRAANEYIYQSDQVALNTIDNGLRSFPGDEPLINLKEKILKDKEQEQEQQQQNQQNQEEQDQQEQEQEQQEQNQEQQQQEGEQDKQQQNQEDQKSEEGEESDQMEQPQDPQEQETQDEGEEMQQPPKSREEKLEELNLTEEKARMILEAMKNNEIQYIQQNRRKPTKKSDSSKPDW